MSAETPLGDEIEITPEMIAAGVEELRLIDWDSASLNYGECVTEIYRAMITVKAASETLVQKT